MDSIAEVTRKIRQFRDERDWLQFHNPKELAAAIAIEAAELQELFLWKDHSGSTEAAKRRADELADEIADVAIYLFELADNLGLELGEAMLAKIAKNAVKYPVEKARGSDKKYTELED